MQIQRINYGGRILSLLLLAVLLLALCACEKPTSNTTQEELEEVVEGDLLGAGTGDVESQFEEVDIAVQATGGAIVDSGNCGDNLTWALTDDGILTISGVGEMWEFSEYFNTPWYHEYSNSISEIVIEEGVTSIGQYAFELCEKVVSITIADGMLRIGRSAFQETSLKTVTIPDSVTSIGEWAFYDCYDLAEITLSSELTSIGSFMFNNCVSLTSITIPDCVESIDSSAFDGCENMTDIIVSAKNKYYTSIDGVLFTIDKSELVRCPCGKNGSYTIPDGVTSIGDKAFEGCKGLTSIVMPDGVVSIECAFRHCTGLTTITIPGSITHIAGFAFQACKNITDVYYTGSQEDWDALSNSLDSSGLSALGAEIHFIKS